MTAAGAVLDAASLLSAVVDVPREAQRELCIRAGYLCLRKVVEFFDISYNPAPHFPEDSISITRAEFDVVCDQLAAVGVPLKPDREAAWLNFGGWRVNYDRVLLVLCTLTMTPPAPWSTDHAPAYKPLPLFASK